MSIPTRRQYIGRIKQAPHRSADYHYATVEPLIESDATGVAWRGVVADAQTRFPKRGFVHWHDAPVQVRVGSLWQFSIDEDSDTERTGPEQLQLREFTEPIEVIDFRKWADESALRSLVTDEGVELDQVPLARRLVFWMHSGLCIGPLFLKRDVGGSRWILDAPEGQRDAARTPVWVPDAKGINEVTLDGPRLFLAPGQELGRSSGIQNWLSDGQVLRGILKRLRKIDAGAVAALKVTDDVFKAYLDRLASAGFTGVDLAVERARADRLRGIRTAIERDTELLSETVEVLWESHRVTAVLKEEVEEARKGLLEEKRREVDAALESRRAELAALGVNLEERRHELAQVDQELEKKVASFDREVTARLEEIARRPEAAFAESAIIRAVVRPLIDSVGFTKQSSASPHSARVLPAEPSRVTEGLADEGALRNEMARCVLAAGISLHAALALHSALVTGLTPVIVGDSAFDLVRAYASVVAGGRLLWVPAGSSLLEAQDLLGHFDPAMQRVVPHAGGILDLIKDASASEAMAVIVLEGFNRAPVEAYLLPILEAASASRVGDSTRSIPIASQSVVSIDDPYYGQTRVVWPPNVLLACIPAQGSTILPVPDSAWRYLAMIDADDRGRPALSSPRSLTTANAAKLPTELSARAWSSLAIRSEQTTDHEDQGTLAACATDWNLSRRDLDEARTVQQVLCRNGLSSSDAMGIAVAAILVPRATVIASKIDESLRRLGAPEIAGWRFLHDQANQLRQ